MNQPTDKQKKIILILVAIFIGSYVIRYVVNFAASAAYSYQARSAQAAQAEAKRAAPVPATTQPTTPTTQPATQAPPANTVTADPTATVTQAGGAPATLPNQPPAPPPPSPISFGSLTGFWIGDVGIMGRGMCKMQINLLETAAAPGHFTGTAEIPCTPERSLLPPDSTTPAQNVLNQRNPESAQISGLMANNTLQMNVDTSLRASTQGCYFVSLDLSSFGPRQLAVKWQEAPPCNGGTVIVRKVR